MRNEKPQFSAKSNRGAREKTSQHHWPRAKFLAMKIKSFWKLIAASTLIGCGGEHDHDHDGDGKPDHGPGAHGDENGS
tara:strand:- start:423 stop:656 length:234 start_codon:yes stop_codon:yes gene_type:complete